MKLLSKINRKYASFSLLIFLVGLILIFLFIKYFIASETDEKLEATKWNVIKNLNQGYEVEFSPFIEVKEFAEKNYKLTEEIKDTLIYNKAEKDYDSYRQLKAVYADSNKNYSIIVRTDNLEQTDLLISIGIPLSILLLLVMLASNLVVRKISASIWSPFYKNLEKLKAYSVADIVPLSLVDTGIDEFHDLNNSLTELTEKISSDYKNMKEFSENASHELQTPIAIIKAKIETMLQNEKLNSESAFQLQIINETASRLSRINKSLTLLTKLDSVEYEEKKEIALKSFIQKKVEEFLEIAESKRINFQISLLEDITLRINEDLLDLLLSNLLSNAIKHNIEGGVILLKLKNNTFTIKNTGIPLEKLPEKMFERFEKGKLAVESSGLGLAIVKKICESNTMTVSYHYTEPFHTLKIFFLKND